ncbi:MAG: ABC transporter ATP-binding protein [Cardiobacteriaceae bacterium]|nr:ABC transporter ATP-binding protein [Cardiobacteriaceae bacterium]
MMKLDNVTIHRGTFCVADHISLELHAGKSYAILGPNGAGKSSLVKTIFAELPHTGHISYQDRHLSAGHHMTWRKPIGYMPQDTVVDASLTALEIVLLGQMHALSMRVSDEQLSRAIHMMQSLGIVHLAQRDVLDLSGGQRQMVMFAQVLMRDPQILLLDEPVSALDMHHQCVLLEAVRQHTQERQLITLMILHDLNLAAQFADEIILLSDAKIQAQGDPREVLQKETIERIYRVEAEVFYDRKGQPAVVMPRRAIRAEETLEA